MRVPIPTGSIVDLTIEAERPTSVEEVNGAFAAAAATGPLAGILQFSEEPIVSATNDTRQLKPKASRAPEKK